MQSPCIGEASQACFNGCCGTPSQFSNYKSKAITTTAAASRIDFVVTTAASLVPGTTQFTNHECLPSLSDSLSHFTDAFPQYAQTEQTDRIRAQEYYHLSLSNHVCLDYIGLGLFSYAQQLQCSSAATTIPSSSTAPPPPPCPLFDVCYKSVSLYSHVLYGGQESDFESAIRKRIMASLNISETEYSMVFTANCAAAFKLLAESYPFQSNKKLLTVYDYQREGVNSMIDTSQKQGAKVMSAEFSWPGMRISSSKLRKMILSKRKKKNRGLFVFPLQSRMTGTRYSYQWMNIAQENGWHVALDACALGTKDMDTLGLSLFRPDFVIYSFYKVFGENPSGFGCLFIKKSSASLLEASDMSRCMGIVSLVPANKSSQLLRDSSGTESDTLGTTKFETQDYSTVRSSFSGEISASMPNGLNESNSSLGKKQLGETEHGETSQICETETLTSDIVELDNSTDSSRLKNIETSTTEINMKPMIQCRGLDHADSLGLVHISTRARCLINWLVNALTKLHHPHAEKGLPLVQIYGPKIKFDRGPAVAFSVFDWKGEKIDPILVQKLADRSNVSLSCGFLQNLWFSDKYEGAKERVLESRTPNAEGTIGKHRREKSDMGITVVTASLGFLANFEDTYRLWAFVARFLDADFVEKERWRYMALNQKIVEV